MFMNGVRLGTYQVINNIGLTKDENGNVKWVRSVLAGAFSGCLGAAVGSPFYMVIIYYINPFPLTAILHQMTFRKILNVHSAEGDEHF